MHEIFINYSSNQYRIYPIQPFESNFINSKLN